jgi:hypothetical protein
VGAEIMGAGMFGFHAFPDDPHWRGWWGEEPPFRVPVLVLTHRERPAIDFANGTRFEFLAATPEDALARAREHAGSGDIRVGKHNLALILTQELAASALSSLSDWVGAENVVEVRFTDANSPYISDADATTGV